MARITEREHLAAHLDTIFGVGGVFAAILLYAVANAPRRYEDQQRENEYNEKLRLTAYGLMLFIGYGVVHFLERAGAYNRVHESSTQNRNTVTSQ